MFLLPRPRRELRPFWRRRSAAPRRARWHRRRVGTAISRAPAASGAARPPCGANVVTYLFCGNRSKTSPTPDDDDTPRLSRWHQPGSLVAVIIAIVAILWALRVAPFLNSTADGSTATETAAPSPTLSNLTAESACEHLRSKAASSNVRAAGHEQENFNLLVLGGSGLGKDTALANLFRGQDPKWRHTALLTIRQRADTALQACNERKRLSGDEQSAKERRDFVRAGELKDDGEEKETALSQKLVALEQAEAEYEERKMKIDDLEQQITSLNADRMRLADDGKYDEAQAHQGKLDELNSEHAQMVTRWTDVQGTPNITMQIEVKTIRRMPVAPGSRTMIDVQLINTPGYGSIAHSLDDSYKMIDDELERRMQEVARVDARPHVHRLMEADLIMMRKIQDRCPLIPVIAKADTMTIQEAEKFKDTVRRELKVRNITTAHRYELDARPFGAPWR